MAAIDNMDGFDYFDRPLRVRKAIKTGKDSTTTHITDPMHEISSSNSAANVFGDDGEFLGDRKKQFGISNKTSLSHRYRILNV